jgi:hypothetical protein
MRRFEASKATLIDRLGDLEAEIGQKNEELKELTKDTATTYKKYQIQLDVGKEEL